MRHRVIATFITNINDWFVGLQWLVAGMRYSHFIQIIDIGLLCNVFKGLNDRFHCCVYGLLFIVFGCPKLLGFTFYSTYYRTSWLSCLFLIAYVFLRATKSKRYVVFLYAFQ